MSSPDLPRLPEPPAGLVDFLSRCGSVLVTSHANPDGDAIGSQSGLARCLLALGKEVTIWNLDAPPSVYASLLDDLDVHLGPEGPPRRSPSFDAMPFDAIFFVECPSPERTGLEDPQGDLAVINVDHHLGNTGYGTHDWVLPDMPSVSVMIFQIVRALGAELDPPACDALLLGLVTDTGGFRFSNTTAVSHVAAAEMVAAGASPERVSQRLYESRSEASVRLMAEVLRSLEITEDGAIASVSMDREMLERAGATRQDGEGLIDLPRSIDGVQVAAMFRELDDHHYKISLRSRGPVSVESVARSNGGGGHRNAAGCELTGDLEALKAKLLAELREAIAVAAGSH